MPAGMVTKIGIAATSLLLAAMLLTYSFTGGGEPEAGIEVPAAAGFDLQQRAQAAIEAEARRQAGQLATTGRLSRAPVGPTPERTGIECGHIGSRHRAAPRSRPRRGLACRRSSRPLRWPTRRVPRPRRSCLKHCGSRIWSAVGGSLRTGPLVLSYRNSDPGADATAAAGAQLPDALSGLLQAAQGTPQAALPAVTAESAVSRAGDFLSLLAELNDRELAATARARAAGGRLSPASRPGATRDGNSRGRAAYRSGRLGPYL